MKSFLKTKYSYDFCTTCIQITFPGQSMLQSDENDILGELQKFGPVELIRFEGDKALVRFFNLSSSFLCYNLLNGKTYMGKPVDIIFIN